MSGVESWIASYFVAALGEGGAVLATSVAIKTTLIVGTAAHARRQQKKARRRALDAIEDHTIMVRTSTAVRPIVLGSARISGPFFPLGKSGLDGERLHFVLPLAGAVDGVIALVVGDETITSWDADGWVTSGRYYRQWTEPRVYQGAVNGAGKLVLPELAASIGSVMLAEQDQNPLNPTVGAEGGVTVLDMPAHVGRSVIVHYQAGRTQSLLRIKFHDGQPGQVADAYLMQELPGRWTADHVGHGVSYIAGTMVYHPDVWATGIPNISVILRGERCLDPRTSATAHTYNNTSHARHLLKTVFDCTDEEIDEATAIASANACDESVATGPISSEARYTFDGALYTDMSPLDMLEAVLDSMMGYGVWSGGKWRTYAGVWRPPTLVLTDDDFANEQIVVQGRQSGRDMVNGARAQYLTEKYQVTDAPSWESATYIAEDAGEKAVIDLNLQYVRGVWRAQRIEKRTVLQARQALTVTAGYKRGAYEIAGGDIVELTLSTHGIVEKPMLCADRKYTPAGSITLSLREVAEAIDDWLFDEARTPDPAQNTNLPDVRNVPVPVLSFASGLQFATIQKDGTVRPYLRVYWQALDVSVERVEIKWCRANETVFSEIAPVEASARMYDIYGVSGAERYIVWARSVNGAQVRSNWAAYAVDVDPSAPANGGNVTLGVGANLIPNATMANAAGGWQAWLVDQVQPAADFVPPLHTIGGRAFYVGRVYPEGSFFSPNRRVAPYNAVLLYEASGSAHDTGVAALSRGDYIPVVPGQRIEVQARAVSSNSDARLYVMFTTASGSYISELLPPESHTLTMAEGKTGDLTLDSFKHLYGFVEAPAGAARATWVMHAVRKVSGSTPSFIAAALPYLGYAHDGQTEPTPWSPGPSGGKVEGLDAVGTDQIVPEAATKVLFASPASGTLPSGPGPMVVIGLCAITITNDRNRDVEVTTTASGSVRCYFGSVDNPSYCLASVVASGSPKVQLAAVSMAVAEVTSGNRSEALALVNRCVLAPGASTTISITLQRVNRTEAGPTEYAQLDWNSLAMRVEMIWA